MRIWLSLFTVFFLFSTSVAANSQDSNDSSQTGSASVDFDRDILPVLTKNCLACHNASKAEGGLNLESPLAIIKGGDSGPAIEPGKPQVGSLMSRILDDNDPMPPTDNAVGAARLTEREVASIRSWIEAGAIASEISPNDSFRWQPLPDCIHPVYAMAASADGNYLAFGRGNQAYIIRQSEISSELQAFELTDAAVAEELQSSSAVNVGQQAAHLDIIQSVVFSPNSQTVVTGGFRDIKFWRRSTKPIEVLEAAISPKEAVTIAAISNDGKWVAAASGTHLEVTHLPSGQASRYLKSHSSDISAVIWLEDSNHVLSADTAGNLVLTDCSASKWRPLVLEQADSSKADGSSPETMILRRLILLGRSRFAAVDQSGRLVELWLDVNNLHVTGRTLEGFSDVTAIASSNCLNASSNDHCASKIAVGTQAGVCLIVNSSDWQITSELTVGEPVHQLAISALTGLLATSSGQSPAKLWRLDDGHCISTLDRDYKFSQLVSNAQRDATRQQALLDRLNNRLGEVTKASEAEEGARAKVQESRDKAAQELTGKETAVRVATESVSQAEQALVAAEAALAEAMKLVETRRAELETQRKLLDEAKSQRDKAMTELANREQALATAQDAAQRAAKKIPETQHLISVETEQLERLRQAHQQLVDKPKTLTNVQKIAFDSTGLHVIVADDSARQHVFSAKDGSPLSILNADSTICELRSLPDKKMVALSKSGSAFTWSTSLAWELYRTVGNYKESPWSDRITAMDFSPDGSRLAVASGTPSRSGEVKILDADSGDVVLDLGQVHSDTVFAIKFSPDGTRIATGAADKQCRLFDSNSGTPLGVLEGHTHHVMTLAWKDDGVTLATGSADKSVKLWNVETGTQIRTVGGFKKEVTSLAFVGQTDQFVATDASGLAQLWSASEGTQIRAFTGADSAIHACSVSSDGKLLFAGGQSGNHWVWQVEDGTKLK